MTAPTVRLKLPAVLRAVQAMPWAIVPEKLTALLEVLQLRAGGERFTPDEITARLAASTSARSGDRKPMTKSGGAIAVIPLVGSVVHRASMFSEWSGGTSCQSVARAFAEAMSDPSVSAIVFDCDSPGGSVDGVPELAKQIFDARGKGKQLIAVANTLMASAAYWICAAADEVVVTPSGMVGSIGVFMVHLDESQFDAQVGLTYTLISAGEYKTEGNPYEPLSDEARAALQSQVDDFYGMFTGAVAKYRGVKRSDVQSGYGQGRVLGAQAAVAAGLADRIDTLDGVLAKLGAKGTIGGRPVGAASAAAATPGARADDPTPELEPDGDPDDLVCPDCGGVMNDGECAACGYRMEAPPDGSDTTAQTATTATAAATEGARGSIPEPSITRPQAATEEVMPNDHGTAPGNGAEAAIAAERKRASEIRALGRDHRIDAEKIDAMVDSGISMEAATAQILSEIKARNTGSPRISVGADREAEKPFKTFGEQMFAIVQAGIPGRGFDKRLAHVNQRILAGTPSGMNESVGSEGGFFIQPDLLPGVVDPVYQEDPILSRVNRVPIGSGSNGVKYNVVDETDRTNGNRWGGVQGFWAGEADAGTAKKPKLRQQTLDLKKIIMLAYLTDELTQDAPAAEALLTRAFQAELGWMLTDAIYRGLGAGQPLGILNSGATVSQAIEATQTIANSNTFIATNLAKMLARVPASLWNGLIWVYQQELLPTLVTAVVGTGGSSVPVFIGAGGISGKPYDTIFGRPAFGSEFCEAVGTPGDIMAIVPSQYDVADKGGPQAAQSLHVRFLNDEMTMRMTYRVDGAPVWRKALTPFKGANTRSPFVTLATRS